MHITNEKSCRLWVTIVSLLVLLPIFSYAQAPAKDTIPLLYGSHHDGKRHDPAMNKWRDDRFGQFIHFGLYSVLGGSWHGKHYDGAAEWIKQWAHIPDSSYDSLIHQFDPVDFNATKWAAIAKQMGAKFVIVTTKHHEGFCLWPSKYTNFDLASTPYKKDIIGEIVKAYNKAGIDVYLYYSILDWHHKDWRYDIKSKADSLAFDKYKQYVKDQLTELLERYPTIKGFWFDGTWDNSWKKNGKFSYELEQYLKKLHPGLIIDSRLRADDYGSRHFDS
ncbi:MAG: alpha-L-fucosidase, partial [Chitinophagaceae bacterium]